MKRCQAVLYIGDDYGDNRATMRCQLEEGHEGLHQERWDAWKGPATVTWETDEREEREAPNE